MDASCGKTIATTKKVIRVNAYMHTRVGKLDVPISGFQKLARANKYPTEMDASCGKIIATTKKLIRVNAYIHIRVVDTFGHGNFATHLVKR